MNKRQKQLGLLVITACIIGVANAAQQSDEYSNDAHEITTAKVSLLQAVQKARTSEPGKPVRVKLEQQQGRSKWEVEIAAVDGVYDVVVDASSGTVLSKRADKEDRHEEESED